MVDFPRMLAIEGILNICYPHRIEDNILAAEKTNEIINSLNRVFEAEKEADRPFDIQGKLQAVYTHNDVDLSLFEMPYLGLIVIYGTNILISRRFSGKANKKKYQKAQAIVRHILTRQLLSDGGINIAPGIIEVALKEGIPPFDKLKAGEHRFMVDLLRGLRIITSQGASSPVGKGALDVLKCLGIELDLDNNRAGKLFAAIDISRMPLIDLPIWPVNTQGNLQKDLIQWMAAKTRAPPAKYYLARKVSLKKLLLGEPYSWLIEPI